MIVVLGSTKDEKKKKKAPKKRHKIRDCLFCSYNSTTICAVRAFGGRQQALLPKLGGFNRNNIKDPKNAKKPKHQNTKK